VGEGGATPHAPTHPNGAPVAPLTGFWWRVGHAWHLLTPSALSWHYAAAYRYEERQALADKCERIRLRLTGPTMSTRPGEANGRRNGGVEPSAHHVQTK